MKAKFTSHGTGAVTVEYTDVMTDLDCCRTFVQKGVYVYELIGGNAHEHQVCEELSWSGVTLMCHEGQDFTDKIRAEYRKMRLADKKTLAQ